MKRDGHETVRFFIGDEVEVTPAHGQKTLFVVGIQSVDDIKQILSDPYTQIERNITHIYFGADQSFCSNSGDYDTWKQWEDMICPFLNTGYLCTLDIDVSESEDLLESILIEKDNFIPMISVKLPYINQFNYNTTIKLDDRDFRSTNPGVWCHSLHDLKSRPQFTPWHCYTNDEVIK